MTDDGQLEINGLGDGEARPKKAPRKRQPAKPKPAAKRPARKQAAASKLANDAPSQTDEPDATSRETAGDVAADAPTAKRAPRKAPTRRTSEDSNVVDKPTRSKADRRMKGDSSESAHTDPSETGSRSDTEPRRVFVLTNRMNLNGMLGARLITPRESFDKYYADLSELCPGWVPVIAGPPSSDLIARVTAERGSGGAVLVEIAASASGDEHADVTFAYLRAAALADAKAIHFPDERLLREHRARGYSNVFPHDELVQVSPDLFTRDSEDVQPINAPPSGPPTDWTEIDRVRGAVGAALASVDCGEALAVVAGMLGAKNLPGDVLIPPWLRWGGLAGSLHEPVGEGEGDAERADRLIFQAAYRVLGQQDQATAWSPSSVLSAVIDAIGPVAEETVSTLIDRNLRRVRELIDVEADFEPFRNPGTPYVAAKSLLLVLLRPDLGQLLEWPADETGADTATRVAAAVLAGRLRGVARESIKLRNIALDDITARWAVSRASAQEPVPLGDARFVVDGGRWSLALDGVELRHTTPPAANPTDLYAAMSADARKAARLQISRVMGWPVSSVVQFPIGSQVEVGESRIVISSTGLVQVESDVDEQQFVTRLRSLPEPLRIQVNDLFASLH